MKKFFIIAFFLMLLFIVGCTQEVVVTFDSNGGTEIASVTIIKGSKVDEPEAPVRGEDEFLGWYLNDIEWNFSDPVNSDMTLVAKYLVLGEYQVVFYDIDGNVLKTDLVKEGKNAKAPQAPEVEGFVFVKWDTDFTNVTSDLEVKPIYNEATVEYTVTFLNHNGEKLKEEVVKVGNTVTPPSDPVRGEDEFLGWYIGETKWNFSDPVKENMTLVAKFKVQGEYQVVFYDLDGNVLKTELVKEGKSATAPQAPDVDGYEFVKWDIEFTNVTKNLEVKPIYKEVIVEYTVTFLNYNGIVLKEEKVQKGKNATPPSDPEREGYLFTGWKGDYNNVQSNVVIKAEYLSKDTEYQISYVLNNGIWGFSSKAECCLYFLRDFYKFVNPSESEVEFIYGDGNGEFQGTWKDYIGGVIGSVNKLLYDNNIELDNDEYFLNSSAYKSKWYAFGAYVGRLNSRFNGNDYHYGALDFYRYMMDDPAQYIDIYGQEFYGFPKINEPFTTYKYSETGIVLPRPLNDTFKGWYLNSDFSGAAITEIPAKSIGDIEVYACWNTATTYEITFDSDGAGEFKPITVVYNQEIELPTGLTKDGYTFKGWYLNEKFIGEKFVFTYPFSLTLKAKWVSNSVSLEQLKYNGSTVKYRNSSKAVEIPSDYVQPAEQLRATWVTSFASTFSPSPVEATMKHNLTEVLDLLEEYNMNCMIFHIRTTNNAFYPTDLAPINSSYGTKESFAQWDYLEWLIDECHKRGIEFHAWLNPYRIKAYGYAFDATEETVAAAYANYPLNPASDPNNILMTYRSDGTQGAILNPYEEEVQDYIVDVCLEVMEKYDVDAIHFDDYFYAQMSSGINVLNEPDQDDYLEYINKNPNCGYSKTSSSDKKQWRRDNIDKFIYKLHVAMTDFNKENGRAVQLGISPTGIYRNGNGSVESGSNTAGQEHYSSYLFCDTMNWVRNEWIDYIMPQSYWAFTHSVAGYADVMDWWNSAVDGTRVNLYSGLGLYMSISGGNYSWGVQPYEISNQVLYTTKLKNVKGVSIYSQLSLKQGNSASSRICYEGLMRLKNEYWNQKVATPKTMAHQYLK